MPKINKTLIDSLEPSGGQYFVWDDTLKGFGVCVKPTGVKSFVVQYRNADGASRRMVLGKVGTLTAEQARKLADRDIVPSIKGGGDPLGERRAARQGMTVAELCDWYLREAKAGVILGRSYRPIKASTLDSDRSRIEQHIKPLIGSRALRTLHHRDIAQFQANVAAGKTAVKKPEKRGRGGVTRGGTAIAGRTLSTLKAMLGHAKAHGLIEENPARDVNRIKDGKRDRFLEIEDLRKLGEAMRAALADGENPVAIVAIRFLLLTGCRREEALTLQMDWIDERRHTLRLPDTKTGAQLRPVASHALRALDAVPRGQQCVYAFPGTRGEGPFKALPKALGRVAARAALRGVTAHVLRHTFASIARDLEYSEFTIAGLLGHAGRSVTAQYAHASDASLVAAAERVSATIVAALDGVEACTVEVTDLAAERA